MKKIWTGLFIGAMVMILASCQLSQEEEYVPVKETGKNVVVTTDKGESSETKEAPEESATNENKEEKTEESGTASEVRVTVTSLNIRSQMNSNSMVLVTVPQGEVLKVLGREKDGSGVEWVHVENKDASARGYVAAEFVEAVQ